jgi:hypothetical protein
MTGPAKWTRGRSRSYFRIIRGSRSRLVFGALADHVDKTVWYFELTTLEADSSAARSSLGIKQLLSSYLCRLSYNCASARKRFPRSTTPSENNASQPVR